MSLFYVEVEVVVEANTDISVFHIGKRVEHWLSLGSESTYVFG